VSTSFFTKIDSTASVRSGKITEYEFWVDDDFTGRTSAPVANQSTFTLNTTLSFSSLEEGIHTLNFRFKDSTGLWSSIRTDFFYRNPNNTSQPAKDLVEYEYWFDDDFNGRQSQAIGPQQVLILSGPFSTSGLDNGIHFLNIRFRDSTGLWSSIQSELFYKIPASPPVVSRDLVQYEYWFDEDFAGRIVDTVSGQILNLNTSVSTTGLLAGPHKLHIRFQDDQGAWSSIQSEFFYKVPPAQSFDGKIKAYRYWFDNDFQNHQTIYLNAAVDRLSLLTDINLANIPKGNHLIHFQFMDTLSSWSVVTVDSIYKNSLPVSNFAISPISNCDSTIVQFADSSIDGDVYFWDFGDGSTDTVSNPSHTYFNPGIYWVSLTVTDTSSLQDSTKTIQITIPGSTFDSIAPTACSSYSLPSGNAIITQSGMYYDTKSICM
jgi:hypothetical protein